MTERLILAIDEGTSGTKAVVFAPDGTIRAKATGSLPSIYPRPNFVEQDGEAILADVLSTCAAALKDLEAAGGSVRSIAAVGISNQRETFLLWDEAGRPLGNAVVWQCKRSVDVCGDLVREGLEEAIRSSTGLIADPYFSGSKVIWLYRNDPSVRSAIDAGKARFGTVDSWLLYRLAGGAYRTDYTNASRTLFLNLRTLRWDRDLLDRFGLGRLVLPELRPSASPFGETDLNGLLPSPVPVAAMIGDSHAAAVGQGLFEAGSAKATLGTGSSILMNVGSAAAESRSGMVSTICFSAAARVDYALEGIIVSCGSPLKWLRDALGLYAGHREAEAMARSVPDSFGVALVPAFAGMGAPYWRMDAKGALTGLSFGTRKEHLVRAAFEAAAFQIADIVAAMESDGKIALRELLADGGMTENGFAMQLIADVLGKGVSNLGIAEASALGAARLAALQLGMAGSLEDFRHDEAKVRRYAPGPGRQAALEAYGSWKNAVLKVL